MGPRILTMYLYLNDEDLKGGRTRFDQLNMTVIPKLGRAVLWPSVLDDDPFEMDERTTHQALPVREGVKYGANGMFLCCDFVYCSRQILLNLILLLFLP